MPYRLGVCPADMLRRPAEFSIEPDPATVGVDASNGELVAAALASHVLLKGSRDAVCSRHGSVTAWCEAQSVSRRRWSQLFRGTTWLTLSDIALLTSRVEVDVLAPALLRWQAAQPATKKDGSSRPAERQVRGPASPASAEFAAAAQIDATDAQDLTDDGDLVDIAGHEDVTARTPDRALTRAVEAYAADLARAGGFLAPVARAYKGDIVMATGEADGALVLECKTGPADAGRGVLDRQGSGVHLLTMTWDGSFGVSWRDDETDGGA